MTAATRPSTTIIPITAANGVASHCGCMPVSGTITVGSGVRVRADIAVKCRPAIATHSRLVPLSTARQPEERVKTRNATAPATAPMISAPRT